MADRGRNVGAAAAVVAVEDPDQGEHADDCESGKGTYAQLASLTLGYRHRGQ